MTEEAAQTELTTPPTNKAELLALVHHEYGALEQAIAKLGEAQLTKPIDNSWSAKDILAHIAAWQQILLVFHVERKPFEQAAPGIAVSYETSDVDTINEALHQRDRGRSLAAVLDTFRRSHQQTLATIEGMSEADLFRPYTPPGRDPSSGGQLIDWIAGDTYEHYLEHRETIAKVPSG